MKFILKNIFALLLILLPAIGFSAPPAPPSPAPPPPDMPLDQYLYVLAGIAFFFAFYSFRKKTQTK
ncbi:hypothetical protein [uncultured Flavobacterium sp.]|uniref:hypothetical protein n=1 Tax=uncultured Flavobacterium sp. TaxID=165435 RepID=UPI0025F6130E|nr:hypothetical protein [uncultured Flavobacterium sp.]